MTRQIENRNFLSPTGLSFIKQKSLELLLCNQANIPDLNLGVTFQPNYLRPIPLPGEIIEFGDLNLSILVDEDT